MKLSSLQENLKSGLSLVSHVSGKNVNLPILNNVLIEAKDGNINLIATDLELGLTCKVRGKIEKEGSYTVDAKILNEYIALLPNKKIDIELKDKGLFLECDNYKTSIKGQLADDFPPIPSIDRERSFRVKADDFRKALSQTVFAVSQSETRIELSGVLFSFSGRELILAATDSYRLAEKKIAMESEADEPKSVIVPAKTLQELTRVLSAAKNTELDSSATYLEFYLSDNQIMFSIAQVELISRLIEGQYPDYKQIIPKESNTKALIERAEVLRAVKASSVFSKAGVNDINLDFPGEAGKLIISSVSAQAGENITEIQAKVEGKDNGLVLNHRYLLDGLSALDGDEVFFEIGDAKTPCLLKSLSDTSYLYLIMPIRQ